MRQGLRFALGGVACVVGLAAAVGVPARGSGASAQSGGALTGIAKIQHVS
ncbi:MAG: hypothetical protein ACLP01_06725 [Solirubrobacteraceae bacterium]